LVSYSIQAIKTTPFIQLNKIWKMPEILWNRNKKEAGSKFKVGVENKIMFGFCHHRTL